jgi:hypothetical protein
MLYLLTAAWNKVNVFLVVDFSISVSRYCVSIYFLNDLGFFGKNQMYFE